MTTSHAPTRSLFRRLRRRWVAALVSVPLSIAGACWWLTADLEPTSRSPEDAFAPIVAPAKVSLPAFAKVEWPASRLDGIAAKRLLLDVLLAARDRLHRVAGYTATLEKQERIAGKLGNPQVLEMKCRQKPFAIYFKYVDPEPGKEVVYAEGRYDNDVIAHGTGLSRRLIPRIKVAPDSSLAMSGNRHPITDAGLANLTDRLINYRQIDLDEPEATTVLDRVTDEDGKTWLRSTHDHPVRHSNRPFKYVEVLYDPGTRLPHCISSYDWPNAGETGALKLAERYVYEDLKLDAPLSDLDFDPANPSYAFTRF